MSAQAQNRTTYFAFSTTSISIGWLLGRLTLKSYLPAGDDDAPAQASRLARQNGKHGLGDVLGLARIAHLPDSGGIDQVQMPRDQLAEGLFRIGLDVLPEQRDVFHVLHL